ncbi:hypothetical protein Pfo_007741 [Paulownia fortunei]|nr:hypothetical protein Pfo_007741 [Paulownia fortunei]
MFQAFSRYDCHFFTTGYEVDIINNLPFNPPSLKVHCASKDDDLKTYLIDPLGQLSWRFCMNFWRTTKYFCHFWWLHKDRAFEVFNAGLSSSCGDKICQWYVKEDGFYFGKDLHNKVYGW